MPGIYRPCHPERTILYRVLLFHYFDRFLSEDENRFKREDGSLRPVIKELVERYLDWGNPRCGGQMKIVFFFTDYAVVNKIINHLNLTFVAEKPSPPPIGYQEFLRPAETGNEYFS